MVTEFYTNNTYPFSKEVTTPVHTIHLNKSKLSANVKCIELEPDAYILTWNLKEGKNYTFINEPNALDADHRFTLVYFLKQNAATVSVNNQPEQKQENMQHTGVFANNDTLTEISFSKSSSVQGISIVFTEEWLQKQYLNAGLFLDIASLRNNSSDLFKNTTEENIIIKKLVASIDDNKSILTVKSYFYSLVYGMIKHVTAEKEKVNEVIKNPVMQAVQEVIEESLKGKMPTLKQLANRFYMSVASLKRHFKLAFGSSIYNYFLSRKMEYAKEMLLNAQA